MSIRHSILFTVCLVVVFSTRIIAEEVPVYRWVDKNNVVHFSQHQPKDSQYSKLTTVSSYKTQTPASSAQDKSPATEKELSALESEREREELIAKNKIIIEKNCEASKLNEKILRSGDKITSKGANGESIILSEKEKKEQLELSRKNIALYCDQ